MIANALWAMIRKDLTLFLHDRRAVVVGIVTPIVLGAFFGTLFRRADRNEPPRATRVDVVDQDGSPLSRALAADSVITSLHIVVVLDKQMECWQEIGAIGPPAEPDA